MIVLGLTMDHYVGLQDAELLGSLVEVTGTDGCRLTVSGVERMPGEFLIILTMYPHFNLYLPYYAEKLTLIRLGPSKETES